ncbi:MAG TPA: HAD family hydrolase [Spirochaetia bacterium]|nr:HAD family hydrolase [Spirochaetia bacterium]
MAAAARTGPASPPGSGGIDFFDVDHTLTRRSSGGRFITRAMRQRVLPRSLLLVVAWYSLMYRLGLFRPGEYEEGFPHLRGISLETLERIARESFDGALRQDLFPDAVELLQRRRSEGRRVILATSSLDFIVKPLADFLRVDGMLATELEFESGTCTGRLKGVPMLGSGKKERVLSFLAAEGVRAEDCAFYSDSIYDLPLLECVGLPVAVNPDIRLRRVARRRGWQVRAMSAAPPGGPSRAGRR